MMTTFNSQEDSWTWKPVIVIAVILSVAAWIYRAGRKAGKRVGSRQGYGAGSSPRPASR
jgi:hypothetical protein